jgi:hypothetical protein
MFRPANTIYSVLSAFVAEQIDSLERKNKEAETEYHGNLNAVNLSANPRHSNVENLERLTQTKKYIDENSDLIRGLSSIKQHNINLGYPNWSLLLIRGMSIVCLLFSIGVLIFATEICTKLDCISATYSFPCISLLLLLFTPQIIVSLLYLSTILLRIFPLKIWATLFKAGGFGYTWQYQSRLFKMYFCPEPNQQRLEDFVAAAKKRNIPA